MKTTVKGIDIQNGKATFVKKNISWKFPGGEAKAKESNLETLARESNQELPKARIVKVQEYMRFKERREKDGKYVNVVAYLVEYKGSIEPGAEITESRRMSYDEIMKEDLSVIQRKIIRKLRRDKYF